MNNKFSYKVDYVFAGVYAVMAVVNFFLARWSIGITDVLVAVLFFRLGNYIEAIQKGHLVHRVDTFDYSK